MRELTKKVPGSTPMTLAEAVKLLKTFNNTKFDQSVEIAMRLGIDPKQADQIVRGSIVLPNGIGKSLRVVVFAKGDKLDEALQAGAVEAGGPELAQKIKDGWTDFDACIATPDMMGVVGPLGKILGPRGLMPNPKSGTVTMDIGKAVSEVKAGKIDFKVDKYGIIHSSVGKNRFTVDQLVDNVREMMGTIIKLKPTSAKGTYIKSIYLSTTMSPGVQVDPKSVTL